MTQTIPLSDASAWDQRLTGTVFGPAHTSWFNKIVHPEAPEDCFLYCQQSTQTERCIIPLRIRRGEQHADVVATFGNAGPVFSGNPFTGMREFVTFLRDNGFVTAHISLNQVHPAERFFEGITIIAEKPVFCIPTSETIEDLWRRFGRNNRRHLKRWHEDQTGQLTFDQSKLRDALRALYPDFAARRNVSAAYRFNDEQIELFSSDPKYSYLVGVTRNDGSVRFVRCFLFTEHWADAFIEAQAEDSMNDSRPVYWAGIEWAHRLGIPFLNLSGGITSGDSLEFFKKSLGGIKNELFRAPIIADQTRYEVLCAEAGVPKDISPIGYFPPYHTMYRR